MKGRIAMRFSTLLLGFALCAPALAEEPATNAVAQSDFTQLILAPEKYKFKQVCYSTKYRNLVASFPPYMEASGFKGDKYFLLEIGDIRLPVIAKKSDLMISTISDLKIGSTVKVIGKIKEFKVDPRRGIAPHFYVELKTITVVSEPPARDGGREPPQRGPLPPPPATLR